MSAETRQNLISVVIPVYNGEATIGACLRSVAACRHPAGLEVEVLVVDDGSTDATRSIVTDFPAVRLIQQANAGPAAARNRGIRESCGEAILFTDDDCEVDPAWLIELANTLRTSDAAAAGGAQLQHPDDEGLARDVSHFLLATGFCGGYTKLGNAIREVKHNAACNSAYRRDALAGVGGFAEGLWPGEDVELDLRIARLGGRIIYNPRARVHHRRCGTWSGFIRMMSRYGRWSGGYLTRKYGLFRPLSVAPLFFAALMALCFWHPLVGLAVSLILALLALRLFQRVGTPLRSLPRLLALTLVGAIAWNLGFVSGLFVGRPLRPGLAVQPSQNA